MQSISDKNLKGIDASHWDGDVDYSIVKSQGYKIVYIKATEGDTLSKIALAYNTTVENLMKLNGIKNANNIYVGQIIKIN